MVKFFDYRLGVYAVHHGSEGNGLHLNTGAGEASPAEVFLNYEHRGRELAFVFRQFELGKFEK